MKNALLILLLSFPLLSMAGELMMGATYPEPFADKVVVELKNDSNFSQRCGLSIQAKCVSSDGKFTGKVSSEKITKTLMAGREVEIKFDFKKSMDRIRKSWRDEDSVITEVVMDSLRQDCQRIGATPNPRPNPNPRPDNRERRDAAKNFITYVKEGNLSKVKLALTSRTLDVNKADEKGRTPLNLASDKGHIEIVKLLLGHPDIEVNKADEDRWTPLNNASSEGRVEIVKLLIGHSDIDVNKPGEDGVSPLGVAAYWDHLEIVKMLVGRWDINLNKTGQSGRTPLYLATEQGHSEVVKFLLGRVDVEVNKGSKYGVTPLFAATEF